MKTYKKVRIKKAKEYSRSYGNYEFITYPLAFVEGNSLSVISENGNVNRTFRIGTRLMPEFSATEITTRSFKVRRNKLYAAAKIASEKYAAERAIIDAANRKIWQEKNEATKNAFTEEVKARFINKWAEINPENSNYISHKQANSFSWKKQNYLGIEKVDIVELRSLVKSAINK